MAHKATQTNHTASHAESLLSKFRIDYELDKTWKEAKQDVKSRTERKF